jgi:hypothetical protein
MQTTDPTTDRRGRVVNRTDALQVSRLLSAMRGGEIVMSLGTQAPHLFAEFLMTDEEAAAVQRQNIIVRTP